MFISWGKREERDLKRKKKNPADKHNLKDWEEIDS